MSTNNELRGLVRSATFVQSTFHAPTQQHQRPVSQNANKHEDFGDLLGHNRNPNMGMVIRQRRAGRKEYAVITKGNRLSNSPASCLATVAVTLQSVR